MTVNELITHLKTRYNPNVLKNLQIMIKLPDDSYQPIETIGFEIISTRTKKKAKPHHKNVKSVLALRPFSPEKK